MELVYFFQVGEDDVLFFSDAERQCVGTVATESEIVIDAEFQVFHIDFLRLDQLLHCTTGKNGGIGFEVHNFCFLYFLGYLRDLRINLVLPSTNEGKCDQFHSEGFLTKRR